MTTKKSLSFCEIRCRAGMRVDVPAFAPDDSTTMGLDRAHGPVRCRLWRASEGSESVSSTPPSGFYSVSWRTVSDSCQPMQQEVTTSELAMATADGANVVMWQYGKRRQDLTWDKPLVYTWSECGATISLEVTAQSSHSLVVDHQMLGSTRPPAILWPGSRFRVPTVRCIKSRPTNSSRLAQLREMVFTACSITSPRCFGKQSRSGHRPEQSARTTRWATEGSRSHAGVSRTVDSARRQHQVIDPDFVFGAAEALLADLELVPSSSSQFAGIVPFCHVYFERSAGAWCAPRRAAARERLPPTRAFPGEKNFSARTQRCANYPV